MGFFLWGSFLLCRSMSVKTAMLIVISASGIGRERLRTQVVEKGDNFGAECWQLSDQIDDDLFKYYS